jgi:sugar-specific transcriptional regulator TrmB
LEPSENNAEILIDFGLTGNQAKVYIATAKLRLASVSQISKVSKVRREDVYRILPKLEKMGLVERLLGTPTKIRATPVEEALSILIKREEDTARERLSTLKTKTKTFLKHLANAPRLELEEKANFALLSKRESITSKMLTMVKNAERELEIACSGRKIMPFIHTFAEQLKRIITKEVKVRIISDLAGYEDTLPRVIKELASPTNSIDLRCADLSLSHYMIVDFKEALISTATEGSMGENPCLWTNSSSLVGVFQGDFENLWHSSVDWKNGNQTSMRARAET